MFSESPDLGRVIWSINIWTRLNQNGNYQIMHTKQPRRVLSGIWGEINTLFSGIKGAPTPPGGIHTLCSG